MAAHTATTTGSAKSTDGTAIAFTKMGQGPALVLVDGALCFRENGPSAALASLLAQHFTVYAYDRRGRGESGDTQPYSVSREIDDLKAILARAGDSAFVFGSSSGAVLAMLAAADGAPIRKLVLYEPAPSESIPGSPDMRAAKRQIEALLSTNDRAGAVRYFLSDVVGAPALFVRIMPLVMHGTWTRTKSAAHTLPRDLAMLSDNMLTTTQARRIAVPTLVVSGGKSPELLQEATRRTATSLPNARALVLPGQSHDVAAAAKALTPVMVSFLMEGT